MAKINLIFSSSILFAFKTNLNNKATTSESILREILGSADGNNNKNSGSDMHMIKVWKHYDSLGHHLQNNYK